MPANPSKNTKTKTEYNIRARGNGFPVTEVFSCSNFRMVVKEQPFASSCRARRLIVVLPTNNIQQPFVIGITSYSGARSF